MIPQAGKRLRIRVCDARQARRAWIIGWDLILEYAVGNVAVAISWGDYFNTLIRDTPFGLPVWLTTGYRTALLNAVPEESTGCSRRRRESPACRSS